MYKGKKILAVVPARGGSKRIPKKNLKKINGKSLIKITVECILLSKLIDHAIISSDDEDILKEGNISGLSSYFKRPKSLSGDLIGDMPVLKHALIQAEKYNNCFFDIILMLQPTAPNRKLIHIEKVIKKIIKEKLDTVWTIHEVDRQFHPDKQLKIDENKQQMSYFTSNGKNIIANQELGKSFMKNGICYGFSRKHILNKENNLAKKNGFILLKGKIINIDNNNDLKTAKKLLKDKT